MEIDINLYRKTFVPQYMSAKYIMNNMKLFENTLIGTD